MELALKRGATLRLSIAVTQDSGAALDLTGMTVTMQLRDSADALVATLSPVNGGATGLITVVEHATAAWPIGALRGDIRIVNGPETIISHSYTLRVDLAVTR